jgi:hypothetical protein
MRRLAIAVALFLGAAPDASAQRLAGSDWASSSAGHLAFVTQGDDSGSTLRVLSPDGQVSPAEAIVDNVDEPDVAVGARGDVIVAWNDREKRLWSRYRPAGGSLGPPELVAPNASALLEALPLALDAAGGAVIAWTPEDGAGGLHVR